MPIDLTPVPPREAIAALARRGGRLDPTFAWQDAWQADHAAMFTVAKSAGFDILNEIHAGLVKALSEGTTFRDFARELAPFLQSRGWWGRQTVTDPATGERRLAQLGSVRRLRTIFDVNMRVSYASGHWASFERSRAARPFLRYVAILDDATRPQHRARHNLVLPVDHPYWDVWAPPCGWNCRCTLQSLSRRDVDRLKRQGEALFFEPPPDTYRTFVNRRTGEVTRVPDGIDPGWAYNPGKAGWQPPPGHAPAPPPRQPVGANVGRVALDEADEDTVYEVLDIASPEDAAGMLKGMVRDIAGPVDMRLSSYYGDVQVQFRGAGWYAKRSFRRHRGELEVEHDLFTVEGGRQGGGIATTLLANSMEVYRDLGVGRINVHADIDVGGYAWAKFGFVPTEESWDELRDWLSARLSSIDDPVRRQAIAGLLESLDPRTVWILADSPAGKSLLLNSDWLGTLDLADPMAMDRFLRYIRRSRRTT